jgi:hypothetical protein
LARSSFTDGNWNIDLLLSDHRFVAAPVTFLVVFDLRDTAKNALGRHPLRAARPMQDPIGFFVLRLIFGEAAAIVGQMALNETQSRRDGHRTLVAVIRAETKILFSFPAIKRRL